MAEDAHFDAQDRVLSFGDCTYEHDAAGFLATRQCELQAAPDVFDYDARRALRGVGLGSGEQIAYLVDALGRRIGKKRNGVLEQGWLYLDLLRPAAQIGADGVVGSVFVYGTRENVPDLVLTPRDGKAYRIVVDHVGSPRVLIDTATGAVVHRMDFDEWGVLIHESGDSSLHPFGFAGGLLDRHTGLTRFGVRDYDARLGRWTSKDPLLFSGGQTNLYAYVNNDPVNRTDPTGLILDWLWDLYNDWDDFDQRKDAAQHIVQCKEVEARLTRLACENKLPPLEVVERWRHDMGCDGEGWQEDVLDPMRDTIDPEENFVDWFIGKLLGKPRKG